MSRFFVGQRVRIVRSRSEVPNGTEARIIDIGRHRSRSGQWADCGVQPDGYEMRLGWSATFDQLEPILPEGHAPSVYSFEELMDKCRSGVVA